MICYDIRFKYDSAEHQAKPRDAKKLEVETAESETAPPKVDGQISEPVSSVAPLQADANAGQNQPCSRQGETGSWFTHANPDATKVDDVRHHGASSELNANAARMRGESTNWFSYDHSNKEPVATVQCSKGRQYRQATDNMHDVFHHASK